MEEINRFINLEAGLNDFSAPFESALVERASDRIFQIINSVSYTLAVIMSFILGFEYDKIWRKVKIKLDEKNLLRILVLFVLFVILPVFLIFILVSAIYKYICYILIKRNDVHFISFLDSFNVFWSLDDDVNKNVTEILGFIEADSPDILVNKIREKFNSLLNNATLKQLFYKRHEKYGFYYWHKNEYIDVTQYVKILKISNKNGLNKNDLEVIMTELSHEPMPCNGEGLFEILVTDIKLTQEDFFGNYAIIFRIHRSVGEGIEVIDLLCNVLEDENKDNQLFKNPEDFNLIENNTAKNFTDLVKKFGEIIISAVDGVIRRPDLNSLHGPMLEDKKYFKWIDTDNIQSMIEELKEKCYDINFTDVLATALSSGLREYFSKTMLYIPDNVGVVIPIRLNENAETFTLENNFTVSTLRLPIKGDFDKIRQSCNRLRKSLDPLTNHYLLKLCNIFPKCILKAVCNSNQATMVFSNMSGPKSLSICSCAIQSLVFFVPNKGTTGVGVTALSYGGVLRLAIMADSAVLSSPDDLSIILKGMVQEIKRLHKKYVWSKSKSAIATHSSVFLGALMSVVHL